MRFLVKATNWLFQLIKIFSINFLILYLLLFLMELFFQFKNDTLFLESKFIHRERLEDKLNQEVHVSFVPYKMIHSNELIVPLSGISDVTTIFCREGKKYYTYFSDKYGFNNQGDMKLKDTLLIGDSYVQGLCVEPKFSLTNNLNAINFGFFGNGPLTEYATFREYHHQFNFNKVVWFFTIGNDFYDFSEEIQNPILNNYLKDKTFSQNLVDKDDIKNELIKNTYFNYEARSIKEKLKYYHLDIKYIREVIVKFFDKIKHADDESDLKSDKLSYYEEYVSQIGSILIDVNTQLKNNDKSFLVVFHAIHPAYLYDDNDILNNHYEKMIVGVNKLKDTLNLNNINFYDFNDFVYDKYDRNNIDKIFKKIDNGFDHYTIYGNKVLAEKVIDIIGN